MDSVKDYVNLVNEPWGKMFYDLLFMQLNVPNEPKLSILDFGSGLGVTSNHFAAWHDVTAVEPNSEMIENRYTENDYAQVHGGVEKLSAYKAESFDVIICHNVLEYIENKEPILMELMRVLKTGGFISVIKHNRVGRVFKTAVFDNDPRKAVTLLEKGTNDRNKYLGTQYIYSNDDLESWVSNYGGKVVKTLGLRTFYALGQDNSIKYTDEWYENMLLLERKVEAIDDYKNAAFHSHVFIEKV